MSERFIRLFSLPENLYTAGSPVIISAGALLKDSVNGIVLAQLKFKNISSKPIKAIKVLITPMDTVGKPYDSKVEYEYLDLNALRDVEFGQKKAIPLPNASTRAYTVVVSEVIFADNSMWANTTAEWSPLPKKRRLESIYNDPELIKQYRIKFGEKARFLLKKSCDLWLCTCGAVNRLEEEVCHVCENAQEALFSCDPEELKAEANLRVKQTIAAKRAAQKKRSRIIGIIAASAFICLSAVLIVTKVIIPNNKYNHAVALLEDRQFDEAIAEFESLDRYKDSAEKCMVAKYEKAIALLDAKQFDEAITAFDALGEYNDSIEKKNSALQASEEAKVEAANAEAYQDALTLEEDGQFENAIIGFEKIVDYKDASAHIEACKEAIYLRAEQLMSAGSFADAIADYQKIYGYKDSIEKTVSCENSIYERQVIEKVSPIASAKIGDEIPFGIFEQDNDKKTTDEPIIWIVVAREGNKVLLLSKKCIYGGPYNNSERGTTWENCSLRKWLNDAFYLSAFSELERSLIALSDLQNKDYSYKDVLGNKWTTSGGNDTQDHVFLLSYDEVKEYLIKNKTLFPLLPAEATKYAERGLGQNNVESHSGVVSRWWTRTPGEFSTSALCVAFPYKDKSEYKFWDVYCYRGGSSTWSPGVRPAVWIDYSVYLNLLDE